jgi:hypothetical protein
LTLEEDVAARLKAEARRSGRPFKQIVNEFLRLSLARRPVKLTSPPFKVRARRLDARPGVSFESVSQLLEQLEGPSHR